MELDHVKKMSPEQTQRLSEILSGASMPDHVLAELVQFINETVFDAYEEGAEAMY